MSLRTFVLAFFLVLLIALPSAAQVPITLTGGDSFYSNGYAISPYAGTLNGTPVAFYCLDFSTPVGAQSTWTGHITLLANSSSYANTLQYSLNGGKNATALQTYLEMAWLILQMQANPDSKQAAEDQFAIWSFTGGPDPFGLNAALVSEAAAAVYAGFTVNNWEIITADSGMKGQEFMLPTPEPPTVVLLALGVLFFLLASAYRRSHYRSA